MVLLTKLFEVLFPVFLIIGIGYWYGKKDPKFNTKFITTFAGNFGLPAIIFYSLTTTNISFELFLWVNLINYFSSVKSNLRKVGKAIPVDTTVIKVIQPPKTTAVTVPISLAVKPLSKAPSSLEEPVNILSTEETLPRIASGVFNCIMVWRITIETPSVTPLKNNAKTEIQYTLDKPKTIIQIPNPNMAVSNL